MKKYHAIKCGYGSANREGIGIYESFFGMSLKIGRKSFGSRSHNIQLVKDQYYFWDGLASTILV